MSEPHVSRPTLRAPRENFGTLVSPPGRQLAATVEENTSRRAQWQFELAGQRFADWASEAREQAVAAALDYSSAYSDVATPTSGPIFVGGHQPTLFHPGVWLKNFALHQLAARQLGVALNLVIDGDAIGQASIDVPGGTPQFPTIEKLPFDAAAEETPFEHRAVLDPGLFQSFGHRVSERMRGLVARPLIETYWPRVLERSRATALLGASLAQARHRVEGSWGLSTLELPQSRLCDLPAFHRFAAHLLGHLPRFQAIHNAAVLAYRQAHRLRSANHPFPLMTQVDDWLEAPFWVWTADQPRRRRMFVRQAGRRWQVTDRHQLDVTLELPSDLGGEMAGEAGRHAFAALADQGVRLRSRALTTTLFARLALADLFVHGLGGGKYDAVTDQVIEHFFGVQPPEIAIVTGTLELPIASTPVDGDARRLAARERELRYHPERFLPSPGELASVDVARAAELAAEKTRWIAAPFDRGGAKTRCRAIRAINEALQPLVAPAREKVSRAATEIAAREVAERVRRSREFAFCLHPEKTLSKFLLEFHLATA